MEEEVKKKKEEKGRVTGKGREGDSMCSTCSVSCSVDSISQQFSQWPSHQQCKNHWSCLDRQLLRFHTRSLNQNLLDGPQMDYRSESWMVLPNLLPESDL